eukprot:6491647-Amphidinium_carterae.3
MALLHFASNHNGMDFRSVHQPWEGVRETGVLTRNATPTFTMRGLGGLGPLDGGPLALQRNEVDVQPRSASISLRVFKYLDLVSNLNFQYSSLQLLNPLWRSIQMRCSSVMPVGSILLLSGGRPEKGQDPHRFERAIMRLSNPRSIPSNSGRHRAT